MKVAVIGAGHVGSALGSSLARAGHAVTYGVRDPGSDRHAGRTVASVADAVQASELAILATPWDATEAALAAAGDFGGRPLLDATNPIGPGFALTHAHTDSGGEQVARWARGARVVKVFDTTGAENLADASYPGGRPVMFACGDDASAVQLACGLAEDIGFRAVALGGLQRARLMEPVALLWIRLSRSIGRGHALGLLVREGT